MTNGEVVSRIINDLRSLTKDDRISRRFVLHIARSKAENLIAQKLRDKTLYRDDLTQKTIQGLELKKAEPLKCGIHEFARCESLMKSKKKLPKLIYSLYGSSILSVSSIDGQIQFDPITLKKYNLNKKRDTFNDLDLNFFYVKDRYLYLPDSEIECVDVSLITLETEDTEIDTKEGRCGSVWDLEFNCPDKFKETVIIDTLNEVANSKGIPIDENPNLDSNIKSQTTV